MAEIRKGGHIRLRREFEEHLGQFPSIAFKLFIKLLFRATFKEGKFAKRGLAQFHIRELAKKLELTRRLTNEGLNWLAENPVDNPPEKKYLIWIYKSKSRHYFSKALIPLYDKKGITMADVERLRGLTVSHKGTVKGNKDEITVSSTAPVRGTVRGTVKNKNIGEIKELRASNKTNKVNNVITTTGAGQESDVVVKNFIMLLKKKGAKQVSNPLIRELIKQYTPSRVEQTIRRIDTKVKNPVGFLVKALKEDWQLPPTPGEERRTRQDRIQKEQRELEERQKKWEAKVRNTDPETLKKNKEKVKNLISKISGAHGQG